MKQRDYLFQEGVIETGTTEGLEAAKKQHKKVYQKAYQKDYKKRINRKEIHLSDDEVRLLETCAKEHKMKMRPFMKACVFGYLNKTFIGVDEEQLHQALVAINRVGNNINQIAHHLNRGDAYNANQVIKIIYGRLDKLETEVSNALTCPSTLEDLFVEAAKNDVGAIDRLEELIADFRANQNDDV